MESAENNPPGDRATAPLPGRRLSTAGTILAGCVVIVALVLMVWSSWSSSRLDSVGRPEAALSLIVGRIMELRESISEQSPWERRLYSLLFVSTPRDTPLAITWFEELVARSESPIPNVELAILEAENGLTQKVEDRVAAWKRLGGDFPAFANLMEIAYRESGDASDRATKVDLSIVDRLRTPWFRDRLIARLQVTGNVPLRGAVANSDNLLGIRVYAGVTLLMVVSGLLSLPWILARLKSDAAEVTIATAAIPPPWNARTSLAVLLRVGAVFLLVAVGIGILTPFPKVSGAILLTTVYLVGIAVLYTLSRKYLLDGSHKSVVEAFGISILPHKWGRTIVWTAFLTATGIVGELGIVLISDSLGAAVHWTEWFDEDLAWGTPLNLNLLLLGVIVFAPVFEELLFRGLIFQTLRQKYSFGTAAGLSAVLFSILHGYSIAGFFALLWGGFVWAWSVEETKSLLPAIIAHGLHNLLMALGLILFLRA